MQQAHYPTVLVLFGATGDLSQRKLLPALFDLYQQGRMPDRFLILGASRKEMTDVMYRDFVIDALSRASRSGDHGTLESFCERIRYVSGDFTTESLYHSVLDAVRNYNEEIGQCSNTLFYLAVPPAFYGTIFTLLHTTNSMAICDPSDNAWARLLVEKPFGRDLTTAQALEDQLCGTFADEQVYRIDHYLAKNAIENILSLRFGNTIFRQVWNAASIESVTINLYETHDVAGRGTFYDGVGALRDVGQNHLLQIVSLLLMKIVNVTDATAMREARAEVIESLQLDSHYQPVQAQYAGYQEHENVSSDSRTETFFRLVAHSSLPEWEGVPLYLSAGKALDRPVQEVVVQFTPVDAAEVGLVCESELLPNTLRITFAPEQRMQVQLVTRKRGYDLTVAAQEFTLVKDGPEVSEPEAYELVLLDCIAGDQTRFVSSREVTAAWRFITPILESFATQPLHSYAPGDDPHSIGPCE